MTAASALFDAVEDRFGRLDVVVHTAGINQQAARRVRDDGSGATM